LFMKATSISELIAIRGLDGLAWACFWPPMEALATETSDTGQIGRGIGLVTSVYALGFAIGSFAGGFITTVFGFALTFFTYFVFAALSILAVWLIAVPRHSWPSEPLLGDRLLPRLSSRDLIAGNVLGASYTFGLATIMALLSVYAAGIEIPVYWIGIAFSIFWVGRIIGAAFSGTASDRLGRRRVVMSALIAGSVGFVLIGIAPGFLLLATGAFLAGLSIGGVFPVNVAIIADDVAPARRGTAMGLYETVCAIAFMAASVLGGTSANLLTPRMPYMLSAVVFVSCAAALAILLPYRPRQSTRFERNVAD